MGNKTSSPATQPNNDKKDNKKNKKLNQKDINKIIIQLSDFEVLLNKKIAFVESQMDKELKNAKKHGKKNKRAALGALRRKRNLETKIVRLEGILSTIELQREALESANTNAEILRVMKHANSALKNGHANLNVDNINQLMDEVAEQQEFSQEINTAISQPVGFDGEVDQDELMQELEDLMEEDKNKDRKYKKREPPSRQVSQNSRYSYPDVPTDDLDTISSGRSTMVQRKREAEVIKALEEWGRS